LESGRQALPDPRAHAIIGAQFEHMALAVIDQMIKLTNGTITIGSISRWVCLTAGVWALCGGAGAWAQTIPGEQDYKNNCAVCHGPTGKGDGEAVAVLPALKPKDLTQLTTENHGVFPAQAIYQAIDGRDNIAAHELGGGRMPTWAVTWQLGEGEPNRTSEANTRKRIQDLVSYIKTLQEK
jgi:mono/diheme cytochrome c family protein